MKNLNHDEIQSVNGAGVIADVLTTVGETGGEVLGHLLDDFLIPWVDTEKGALFQKLLSNAGKSLGERAGNSIESVLTPTINAV